MSNTPLCARNDCGAIAKWIPVVCVWPAGYRRGECSPVKLHLGVLLCDRHSRYEFTRELLTDEIKKKAEDHLAMHSKRPPDWSTAWIKRAPLTQYLGGAHA